VRSTAIDDRLAYVTRVPAGRLAVAEDWIVTYWFVPQLLLGRMTTGFPDVPVALRCSTAVGMTIVSPHDAAFTVFWRFAPLVTGSPVSVHV
jgi:hypothetical protein